MRVRLFHEDVVVWGDPARLAFHGMDILRVGDSSAGPFRYSPGFDRRARTLVMWTASPVTSDSAHALRTTCPPPSPSDPSIVIISVSIRDKQQRRRAFGRVEPEEGRIPGNPVKPSAPRLPANPRKAVRHSEANRLVHEAGRQGPDFIVLTREPLVSAASRQTAPRRPKEVNVSSMPNASPNPPGRAASGTAASTTGCTKKRAKNSNSAKRRRVSVHVFAHAGAERRRTAPLSSPKAPEGVYVFVIANCVVHRDKIELVTCVLAVQSARSLP